MVQSLSAGSGLAARGRGLVAPVAGAAGGWQPGATSDQAAVIGSRIRVRAGGYAPQEGAPTLLDTLLHLAAARWGAEFAAPLG